MADEQVISKVENIPTELMTAGTGDGNPNASITGASFDIKGQPKDIQDALALVVQSANSAKAFIQNKQWVLLWRDADLLYQSPRPMTVYENTYVLEPNVQRFTVAKVCNAVVPQLYKGLFYDDPPMILRPESGTPQEVTDAKTKLFNVLLDECKFKQQTKWGLENMACFGTGIWKWGIDWKERVTYKRKKTTVKIQFDESGDVLELPSDTVPEIVRKSYTVPMPFIEWRPVDKVLVDPHLAVPDIREAKWAVDVRYMDYYDFSKLMKIIKKEVGEGKPGESMNGWRFPTEAALKEYWEKTPPTHMLETEQSTYMEGVVHHAQKVNVQVSPNPLRNKLEVYEYYDKGNKIMVLNQAWVFFKGKNEFEEIPFLSSNWWNRPRAFYGMGLGMIVGQNQRVDQGTINAILKILSFGVNPVYMRSRDENAPTQMIRTSLGKILTVADIKDGGYKLMEIPKTPPDIWTALSESEKATESASGADQALVQGSTAGPRTSMGRTAGGANLLAGASATRLDGPLDNFIDQVFKPFLGVLDMLVHRYMSDGAILRILGDEYGYALIENLKIDEFFDYRIEYEVLAGASLSAKRTMAQSMVMLTQIFQNPQIQESLADINEEYIDFKPILTMWLEASEWKNKQDIIKKMTPAMKAKRQANSKAALMQMQVQAKQQGEAQKFQQKQQLEDQASDNRIKRDVIREVARANAGESVTGEPSATGLQGEMPEVV